MDPLHRAQIILLCDTCKITHLQSHCERCHINLCKTCVGEHLSDSSIRHNVVPCKYRHSINYPKCSDHADIHCKHYCEECDRPVCSTCVSSGKHESHKLSDILEKHSSKTRSLLKDLEELETDVYPRYEEMVSDVQTEKVKLEKNHGKLTTDVDQQGDIWHQEITAIVNQLKSDIEEMKNKHLSILNRNRNEITQKMSELRHIIFDLKLVLQSNDISLTSTYKSRNSQFRTKPLNVRVALPNFSSQKINKDQLIEMFGSLSSLSITTEEHGDTVKSPEAVSSPRVKPMKSPEALSSPRVKPMKSPEDLSSPPVKPTKSPEAVSKRLLDEPRLTATIVTGYRKLFSVSCLSEEKFWTRGDDVIMKLFNLQGHLLTSIQTESGYVPLDIAVTRDGGLVYTDFYNKSVNLVKDKQIQTVISVEGWTPINVCSTSSDDLLVSMDSEDETQFKIVRYSGSTETQTIQFDDQGRPLYSSGFYIKYICENRNLDICVADNEASAVVVVNKSGQPRFKYTGHPSDTCTKHSFYPAGITTDSQSHILTADYYNGRIHILDQDGQFLRYIQNCDLCYPLGLSVDNRDNLFVAECDTAKVKKIHYL